MPGHWRVKPAVRARKNFDSHETSGESVSAGRASVSGAQSSGADMAGKVLLRLSAVAVAVTACLVLPAQAAPRKNQGVTHDRVMQSGQKLFDRLDTNKDGAVDATEYAVYVEEEVAKLRARLQKRFADDNLANDGRLTAAEFLAAREKWFQSLDTNHDGVIDQTEFQEGRKARVAPAAAPPQ